MNLSVEIENIKKVKNAKFVVKKNLKDVRRKKERRMIQKRRLKKKELVNQMNIHPVKEVERRGKKKKKRLFLHLHHL